MTDPMTPYGFHGQSGELFVRGYKGPKETKAHLPISDTNKKYLTERGNEIGSFLMNGGRPVEKGLSSLAEQISKYSGKGVEKVGNYGGKMVSDTYGSEALNKAVDFVWRKIFSPTTNSRAVDMTIRATQMTVTPLLLPYVSLFASAGGGLALTTTVSLVGALYNMLLATGKYTLNDLPPPDKLLRYDSDKKCFFDALDQKLDKQAIIDLQRLVHEYDLIEKILTSNRKEVFGMLLDSLKQNEEFKALPESEKQLFEKDLIEFIFRLKGRGMYVDQKQFLTDLAKLARYTLQPINHETIKHGQKMHNLMQEMDTLSNKIKTASEQPLLTEKAAIDPNDTSYMSYLYAPVTWASDWLYYETPEAIAKKAENISKNIIEVTQPELLTHTKKIHEILDNVMKISKEEKNMIQENLGSIGETLADLITKLDKTKNDKLQEAGFNLLQVMSLVDEANQKLNQK